MILPRHKGPVAEWMFEDGIVAELTWASLERSLKSCETVASILSNQRLFLPHQVCLSQWMRAGERKVADSERVEKSDVVVVVDGPRPFAKVVGACQSIIESESVYPLRIEALGSGVIVTDQGDSVVDDLITLLATTLDIFNISVSTQSDVWLPFSLSGESQPDIHRLNAERLEHALQEIQRRTGFKLQEGLETPYAVITEFRLENRRYADGSLEVVD